MINSQIVPPITAILTSVVIPVKEVSPRQGNFFVGNFDVTSQPNNGRYGKISIDELAIVLDLLGFALHQEDHSPPPGTYV